MVGGGVGSVAVCRSRSRREQSIQMPAASSTTHSGRASVTVSCCRPVLRGGVLGREEERSSRERAQCKDEGSGCGASDCQC